MAEETTVDTSGITRSADGTISDGQTTQSDQSSQNTTQTSKTEPGSETGKTQDSQGKTLLTEDKTKVEAETKDDKTKAADGAPEKYEDYKLPEGLTLDAEVKGKADALFKGLGLNQDQAQSLVDFYGEQLTKVAAAPIDAYEAVTDGWREDSLKHPDLRGKIGPGQEINVRIAKALDAVGDPKLVSDFKAQMDLTGAGNHQAFIRVFDWFAKKVTEGTHVAGNGPSKDGQSARPQAPASAAAAIWPGLANR